MLLVTHLRGARGRLPRLVLAGTGATRRLAVPALALLLTTSSAASAQSSEDGFPINFILGVASGYSVPLGSVEDGAPAAISGLVTGFVPVELETGIQLWSHWRFLAYGGFATLVRSRSHCANAVDCGGFTAHVGGKVGYSFDGPGSWEFIVGLGAGWHQIHLSTTTAATTAEATASGVEGILELAALYPLTPMFAMGAFVSGGLVSSSGWTNVVDGETTQVPANHVDGSFNFGVKLELRL